MNCALCREARFLHESHIIPEFMYQPLYDKNHRFYSVSSFPGRPNRFHQMGLREKLLCSVCEQQFSRYEAYASGVFFRDTAQCATEIPTGLCFPGLNYELLRLFSMSLLWRLAVTNLAHLKGADWGCPDLTDSGERVKNPRNPHEIADQQTSSREGELHEGV
jgi:hypothetical protein